MKPQTTTRDCAQDTELFNEHGYEVRINGIEDNAGISDLAAYSRNSLAAIAKVANDLRYEWDRIAEGDWSVW